MLLVLHLHRLIRRDFMVRRAGPSQLWPSLNLNWAGLQMCYLVHSQSHFCKTGCLLKHQVCYKHATPTLKLCLYFICIPIYRVLVYIINFISCFILLLLIGVKPISDRIIHIDISNYLKNI